MTLSYENYLKLEKYINTCEDKRASLVIILHKAQEIFGYIPKEVQDFIAECTNISFEKINELVNFYSFFLTEPEAKYKILVCMGIKCQKKNAFELISNIEKKMGIKEGEITSDGKFLLKKVGCLGACGVGPIVIIGQNFIEKVTIDKMELVLKELV